jgi:plasmid stabilization system protein ParE
MFSVHVKELDDLKTQYTDFLKILNEHDRIILNSNGKNEAVLIKKYLSKYYPSTPKNFVKRLRNCIENIKETPYMYPEYEYYPNYRKAVVEKYLVFYKIDEENRVVGLYNSLCKYSK